MDFDKVQAEWVLGLFPVEELPEFAAQAMVQGFDGPFIMELVSFHRPTRYDIKRELVEGALREMGRPPITEAQAVRRLARPVALKILGNHVTPLDGAAEIAKFANQCRWEDLPRCLRDFDGCVEGLLQAPEYRADYEKAIIELAGKVLEEDPS